MKICNSMIKIKFIKFVPEQARMADVVILAEKSTVFQLPSEGGEKRGAKMPTMPKMSKQI